MQQYRTQFQKEQAWLAMDHEVTQQLVQRLDQFLHPLLVLDAYLDHCLVRIFPRSGSEPNPMTALQRRLLLSELGAMLLNPQQALVGSKPVSRLLHSSKWGRSS